jgi:hypothetical protein
VRLEKFGLGLQKFDWSPGRQTDNDDNQLLFQRPFQRIDNYRFLYKVQRLVFVAVE